MSIKFSDLKEFTVAQLKRLQKEYEPLRGKTISIPNANKLGAMMDRMSKMQLKVLAAADIPFVTTSAISKLVMKHGMKFTDFTAKQLNMSEADELQTEACWTGYKQVGMKKKKGFAGLVPNCVPKEGTKIPLFRDMFAEDKNPIVDTEGNVEEGVDDPAIFKSVFLAGGPGSGKSFTVGKTGLAAIGFKIVNSDDKFEAALKKADLEPTPDNIFSPKGQKLRGRAKELTAKQQELYINGRLGLVIDGTGKNYAKIKTQAEALKKIGYDIAMIFVNTDLETALKRNRERARSLTDKKVEEMWKEVQSNLGKFQSMFGSNFVIVDNSEGSNIEKATTSAYKKILKFSKESPKNSIAKKWIASKLGEDMTEILDPKKHGADDYIDDFMKSDSPQFKGKSKEKIRQMAIAAYLSAKDAMKEGTGEYKGETWEQGYKRRVIKTTDPEHLEKGFKWRIKGKERPEISIKLYKTKPDFKEYSKQMQRVAGHEFGK